MKINNFDNTYDFNMYFDIDDIIGYSGFITPEGLFYRVGFWDDYLKTHDGWATSFLEKQGFKSMYPSSSYHLMKEYNFIIVQYFEGLGFTFSDNEKYSKKQIMVMKNLQKQLKINKGVSKCKKYI